MSIKNNFSQWNSVRTQIPTAFPGTEQVPVVEKTKKIGARKDHYIEIGPVQKEKMEKLSSENWKRLCYIIGVNFHHIVSRHKTISIKNAIIINEVAGDKIFNINEEYVKKYSIQDLLTPAKGRKRQLPASSENPAALCSKKQRTDANDQPTTINVNAPFLHPIPVYVYRDPSPEIRASTAPQEESIISPETNVAFEEFNSTFDSNATAETKQSESPSVPSSASNSSEVFKGFEFDELNNDEMEDFWNNVNTLSDWSDWGLNFNQ